MHISRQQRLSEEECLWHQLSGAIKWAIIDVKTKESCKDHLILRIHASPREMKCYFNDSRAILLDTFDK